MNPKNQEWDGTERRASRQHPPPWEIIEPDGSECPIHHTSVPPEHYEEVMRRLMAGAIKPKI